MSQVPCRSTTVRVVPLVVAVLLLAGCGAGGRSAHVVLSSGWATEIDLPPGPTSTAAPSKAAPAMGAMDMGPSSAAYLTLSDAGPSSDALIGVTSPDAGRVELHETRSGSDGTSGTMRRVARMVVPAGGRVVMRPGGYHLMLLDPVHSLTAGERVSLTLRFRSGTVLHTRVPVLDREDRPAS